LILGLDIYELSDLIIFMTITNILKEKTKFKKKNFANVLGFSSFSQPEPVLGRLRRNKTWSLFV